MTAGDPSTLFRLQLREAAERQALTVRRRRRLILPGGLVVAAIILCGAALAASGWLTGTPAPPSVISDFAGYAPQLGFHPDPGDAVEVAEDGDSSLYATVNAEGSYCIVASAPWRRPDHLPDGGTCIPQPTAAQTIVAGVVAAGPTDTGALEGTATVLVAGRVTQTGTTEVSFTTPTGDTVNRPVGQSGFFLATLSIKLCGNGDWTPTFTALDNQGRPIAQSTFTIDRQLDLSGGIACQFPSMTSAAAPSSHLRP
jgi:hypothetical protein